MGLGDIEQSAEVQAVRSEIGRARPNLELFRDGRIIGGHRCRFTAGRLALLQAAEHPILADADDEVTQDQILSAFYYLAEDNLDDSMWIADDPDARPAVYRKWASGFNRRAKADVCDRLVDWFGLMRGAMPDGYGGNEHGGEDPNWCMTMIDLFGAQYGWTRDYTLWLLPFHTAVRLQDCVAARLGIREQISDISDDAIALLEAAEKAKANQDG